MGLDWSKIAKKKSELGHTTKNVEFVETEVANITEEDEQEELDRTMGKLPQAWGGDL